MRTQINKQKEVTHLKKLFDEHIIISFPETAANEKLYDMKGELALYDGHVAGLVSSYLQNTPVNSKFVKVDLKLKGKMEDFRPNTPEEEKSMQELIRYRERLDKLIFTLSKIIS